MAAQQLPYHAAATPTTTAGLARDIFDRHEDPQLMQLQREHEDADADNEGGDDDDPNHLGVPRYRGVSYEKRKNLWRARLYCRGQHTTLGRYSTARLAATAHDKAASFVFGERAVTNFGAQVVDLPLPFGRTVNIKLSGQRDMMRRTHQGVPGLPNEQQARAMRMAAAAAALMPHPELAGGAAPVAGQAAAGAQHHHQLATGIASPSGGGGHVDPRRPVARPPALGDWRTHEHHSGELLAAITLATGGAGAGEFSPGALGCAFGGGGGAAGAVYGGAAAAAQYTGNEDDDEYEEQQEEDAAMMLEAEEETKGGGSCQLVCQVEALAGPQQQPPPPPPLPPRTVWQALILAAATCSPGALAASCIDGAGSGGKRMRSQLR